MAVKDGRGAVMRGLSVNGWAVEDWLVLDSSGTMWRGSRGLDRKGLFWKVAESYGEVLTGVAVMDRIVMYSNGMDWQGLAVSECDGSLGKGDSRSVSERQ